MLNGDVVSHFLKTKDVRSPRTDGYSVTELTSCLRKSFFNRVFHKVSENNGPLLIGKILHEQIIPQVVPPGTELEKEFKFEVTNNGKTIGLTGHADGMYNNVIYEFKFVNDLNIPPSYFEQVNTYTILANADKYQIIAVNKNNLNVQTWEGVPDMDVYKQTIDKLFTLNAAIESSNPPSGPSFAQECTWCPYRNACYQSGNLDTPKDQGELNKYVQEEKAKV